MILINLSKKKARFLLKVKIYRPIIWCIKQTRILSSVACRLTKFTGKSKYVLHPKHLIRNCKAWFLENIKSSDIILDLGCGNGQNSLMAARLCHFVLAVDKDEKQLNIARSAAKNSYKAKIKFLKINLEKKLPFKANSFNKILALDILEHLKRRKNLLREIKRVLKKNGKIYLSIPNSNTSWKRIQKQAGLNYYTDPDHKREYSLKQIKHILTSADLKILKIKPIVYDTPWAGFIDFIGGISLNWYKLLNIWKEKKVQNNYRESIGFRIILTR